MASGREEDRRGGLRGKRRRRGRRRGGRRRRRRVRERRRLVLRLQRVRAGGLGEVRLRGEEVVRGQVGMLRGEEGVGVRGELVVLGEVGGERLGADEGGVGRLVVRLRRRADVRLVRRMQVQLAHVNRFLTVVRVQRLGLSGMTGQRVRGEDRRPMREMGVWQERGERGREHVREVGRREMLGRVLLHV